MPARRTRGRWRRRSAGYLMYMLNGQTALEDLQNGRSSEVRPRTFADLAGARRTHPAHPLRTGICSLSGATSAPRDTRTPPRPGRWPDVCDAHEAHRGLRPAEATRATRAAAAPCRSRCPGRVSDHDDDGRGDGGQDQQVATTAGSRTGGKGSPRRMARSTATHRGLAAASTTPPSSSRHRPIARRSPSAPASGSAAVNRHPGSQQCQPRAQVGRGRCARAAEAHPVVRFLLHPPILHGLQLLVAPATASARHRLTRA